MFDDMDLIKKLNMLHMNIGTQLSYFSNMIRFDISWIINHRYCNDRSKFSKLQLFICQFREILNSFGEKFNNGKYGISDDECVKNNISSIKFLNLISFISLNLVQIKISSDCSV